MLYLHHFLQKESIFLFQDSEYTKTDVLKMMIEYGKKTPHIQDPKIFEEELWKRESMLSTGIGYGVAIPHVKHESISDFLLMLGIIPQGLEWESLDAEPVKAVFMIAGPPQNDKYLQIISKITLIIKNNQMKNHLFEAKSAEEVLAIFEKL